MTWYAVDSGSGTLLCAWESGFGCRARTISPLPHAGTDTAFALAEKLSELSRQLWQRYLSFTGDTQQYFESARIFREAVSIVRQDSPACVRAPSSDAILDSAEQVLGALSKLDADYVRNAVVQEVREEIDAVRRAESGDLSGRAAQALLLSPIRASPVQLRAAERALHEQLYESAGSLGLVEPTAAAAAAAVWLHAASLVAADESGLSVAQVIASADDIESLPVETPTKVLELLELGASPKAILADLITDACAAQRGLIARLDKLENAIAQADRRATPYRHSHPRLYDAIRGEIRICLLDPRRPSPSLLDDLLAAIRGCWLVYRDYGGGLEYAEGECPRPQSLEQQRACFAQVVRQRRSQLPPI